MTDETVGEPAPERRRPLFAEGAAQLGLFAIVIGFSTMVVLATGGMNLAIGSIGVSAVMATGWLLQEVGLPVWLGLLGGLALGALLGWINGIAIVRTGVNSFIITLASASLFLGLMLILTKAEAFNGLPPGFPAFGKL